MIALDTKAIAAAQRAYSKYGIPASVTLAQYCLESDYGKRMPPGSNNPFGIKAIGNSPFVACPTTEVSNGVVKHIVANFKKYDSLADAFDDHGRLLAFGKPYQRIKQYLTSPVRYAVALTGIYATDPDYGHKLIIIMDDELLTQYDIKTPQNIAVKTTGVVATGALVAEVVTQIPLHVSLISVGMSPVLIGLSFYLLGLFTVILIALLLAAFKKNEPKPANNISEFQEMFLATFQPVLDYCNKMQAQSKNDAATIAELQAQINTLTAAASDKTDESDTLAVLNQAMNGDGVTAIEPPAAPVTQ